MLKKLIRTNKFLVLLGILTVSSGGVFAQQRTWKTFSPVNDEWSVLAPCRMEPDAEALRSPSAKGSYSCKNFGGLFTVAYRDNAKWKVALAKPFINSYYRKIRDSFVNSTGGELVSDEKFANGTVDGREVHIKMQNDRVFSRVNAPQTTYRVGRLRMFFRGCRFYLLFVILPADEIDGAETDNYLNSFAAK